MAKVSATAIEIRANTDRAIAEIRKLDAAVRKQGEAMKKAAMGADKASASMKRYQSAMARATRGGGAFAASMQFLIMGTGVHAFRSLTRAALEYDAALVQVTKTTGIQGASLDNMREKINQISLETGVARSEIAMLVSFAGQLGVSGSRDLGEFAKWVTIIADATDVTGEMAAKTIARLLKVTDTPIMTGIKSVADALIELGNNLSATESEIISIVEGAGVEMAMFGFNAEEILAYSAALASLKGEGAAAATMLNKLFTNIQILQKKGGDELRVFAEVAGIEFEKIKKSLDEDFAGTMAKFIEGATNSLDAEARKEVTALYGLPDMRSGKQLPKLGKNLLESLELAADSSGAALEEFAARTRSTSHTYARETNRMAIAFDELGRWITEEMLPAYRRYAQALEDFTKWLGADRHENFSKNMASGDYATFSDEIKEAIDSLVDVNTGKGLDGKELKGGYMKAVNDLFELGRRDADLRKQMRNEQANIDSAGQLNVRDDLAMEPEGTFSLSWEGEKKAMKLSLDQSVTEMGRLKTEAADVATALKALQERIDRTGEDSETMFGEANREKLSVDQLSLQQQQEALKATERAKALFEKKSGATGFDSHVPTWGGTMRNTPEEQAAALAARNAGINNFGSRINELGQAGRTRNALWYEKEQERIAEEQEQAFLDWHAEEQRLLAKAHQEQMDRISQFYGTWEGAIDDISRSVGIAFTGMNKDINGLGDVWDIVLDRMNNALMESFIIDPIDEAVNSMLKSGLEWLGVTTPEQLAEQQRIEAEHLRRSPGTFPGTAGAQEFSFGGLMPAGWSGGLGGFHGGFGTMVDNWMGGGASIGNQFSNIGSGGGGSWIDAGLSWLGGLIGLSEGGDVRREGMAMVGEHGPELLYLPQAARVQPLGPGRNGAGGGNSFTFNIDADDPIRVRRVVEGMIPEISRAANNNLVSKNSRGGNTSISKAF